MTKQPTPTAGRDYANAAAGTLAPARLRARVLSAVHTGSHTHKQPFAYGMRRPVGPAAMFAGGGRVTLGIAVVGLAGVVVALAVAIARGPAPARSQSAAVVATGYAGARASLKRIGAGGEVTVSGMPEPPAGEVYEVWLQRSSGPPRATDALFTVTSAGRASVAVPGSLSGVREILVTSEPRGGSDRPTSKPVLRVVLARTR